ncbi:TRAP transporter substrate-binding protein [Oscillibacter sp.]|uniref:TRAP transporter substrate-binding protein n=1 Tax=Oscillibacter sp. TaxID=1945593 RepID=UPI0026112628|nr:TRAP transporter substrate-binding protein [Oscillibacter sp.]MDD3347220.1 TRAP transporter substrate-binding protein [Oscillibacter sp.]
MKKILSIVLALALIASLAACGGSKTDAAPETTAPSDTTPAASGSGYTGGEYKLTASSHMAPEDLVSMYMDDFCDRVEEKSEGKITFDRFYSSQIANQAESAEGLKVGTIDVSLNDWGSMASVNGYTKGSVVSLGYLFSSYDHLKAFAASDDYKQMQQELIDQTGIRNLAMGASGFRHVATKNAPITSVDDFKGLRIRVPDIAIYVNTFQALGCATTIVANSEVYTALQTGIVDSVENPIQTIWNMSWYEQIDYINETNHIFCDQDLFMNEDSFQNLDSEAQAVVLEAAAEASAVNMELAESKSEEFLQNCIDAGVEYNTFDTAPIVDIMKNQVWPSFFASVDGGEELVNRILALA